MSNQSDSLLEAQNLAGSFLTAVRARDCVDSTNAWARREIADGHRGNTLYLAQRQTMGRGRMGREWLSPPGASLLMSAALWPGLPVRELPLLGIAAALCACRATETVTKLEAAIKWPNDVLLGGRKVAGILLETASCAGETAVVIGIGVNFHQREFDEEIAKKATSLDLAGGGFYRRIDWLRAFIPLLEEETSRLHLGDAAAMIREVTARLHNLGKFVRAVRGGETLEGVAEAIEPDGALRIRLKSGEIRRVYSGEVSIRGRNGYV